MSVTFLESDNLTLSALLFAKEPLGLLYIVASIIYFYLTTSKNLLIKLYILPSFLSDHSPVIVTLDFRASNKRGIYGWKFNSSLLNDTDFVNNMNGILTNTIADFDVSFDPHIKWEMLKYEARKFCMTFSKAKNMSKNRLKLKHEDVVKKYETSTDKPSEHEYNESCLYLDTLIDERTKGAILRSKCDWYENSEKSTNFFLNLEKRNSVNNTVKKLLVKNGDSNIEVTDSNEILHNLHDFYSKLFEKKIHISSESCTNFLDGVNIPKISEKHKIDCEADISLEDLKVSLFSMSSGKNPGNDGLTVEFYKNFWDSIKLVFFNSVQYSGIVGKLSTSQRQAIIKLLEKRDKDKRFVSNWRPISLLNVDTKIITKTFASKLVPVLPTIISSDQTAYVQGRFIGESTRLISDIIDMSDSLSLEGYILTADIEKAFDSVDHTFLLACLEKFGFGQNILKWVKILLNSNESCVINGGTTSKYFPLRRGARQGDPIAAYFFYFGSRNFLYYGAQ